VLFVSQVRREISGEPAGDMGNIVRGSTVLLALAAILSTSVAQAMEIEKFDRLAFQDQGDYIELLVDGAQKVLIDEGKRDLAAKVGELFTETLPGDKMPLGLVEFERNLALARVADAKRVEKDHNAPRLEVEHAMIVTLKKNGIILPKSFMSVGNNFKPKHPPEGKK
jgi:hypothetical protein